MYVYFKKNHLSNCISICLGVFLVMSMKVSCALLFLAYIAICFFTPCTVEDGLATPK